jgi:hypothetical protein
MLLGDLLAQAERASAGGAAASLDDLSLVAAVAAAAAETGEDPDSIVAMAVRRFEQGATPDDWVSLMGKLSGSADPGKACLQQMVRWSLQRS